MADRPTLLPPIQSSFLIAAPFSVWHSLVRTRWHFYGHFIAPFIHSGESGKPVCALPPLRLALLRSGIGTRRRALARS